MFQSKLKFLGVRAGFTLIRLQALNAKAGILACGRQALQSLTRVSRNDTTNIFL
jgi:hypothetical protein